MVRIQRLMPILRYSISMQNDGGLVIITGGIGGIGTEMAKKFSNRGYKVALGDIKPSVAADASSLAEGISGKIAGFAVDVTDFESCRSFVESALEWAGTDHVQVLVNNAGITRDSLLNKMTYEQWDSVLKVDLYGIFNVTKQVTDGMVKSGFGRIINISSVSRLGNKGQANYSAAKAGIVGFTKTLAKELGKFGITSNAISPGLIDTEILRTIPEKLIQNFIEKIPSGRLGKPEEVASLAAFLASEEASYINGEVININGGFFF